MPQTFLFRFDGARDNDDFLEHSRSQGHIVYAGLAMQLNYGWIPDFIEVSQHDDLPTYVVTIIELESTSNVARVSARKYLPESSQDVVSIFRQYLQRVLERCRLTADSRMESIQKLHDALKSPSLISVWSAGALRQQPYLVEQLPLIDQGRALLAAGDNPQITMQSGFLTGTVSLSPRDHKSLSRSVLILDAVARRWDMSDATLRAWRNHRSQPLRRQIRENEGDFPALCLLLLGSKLGVQVVINDAARELATIWSQFELERHSEASVISALEKFLPIDRTLDKNASVRIAFEKAREILRGNAG